MAPRADGVARPGQDWPTYQPFEPDIMSLNWGPYPGRERFIEAESVVCPAQEHTRQDASARSRTTLLQWHARGQGFESLSSTSKAFFELKLRVGSTVVDPVSYLLARPPVPCFCTSEACMAAVTGQLGALEERGKRSAAGRCIGAGRAAFSVIAALRGARWGATRIPRTRQGQPGGPARAPADPRAKPAASQGFSSLGQAR